MNSQVGHLVFFVIFMMCKCVLSPVSSDKLEGSSVILLLISFLLRFLMGLCLFPRIVFLRQCPFLVHSACSNAC